DIDVNVAGSHGFDKSMAYNISFDVPAKYLGEDVSKLLAQLNDPEAENLGVPVTATIGGSYTNPTIATDLGSMVSEVSKKLVEQQKQKLLGKGRDKMKEALGGILGGDKPTDSITTATRDSVQPSKNDQVKKTAGRLPQGRLAEKENDTLNLDHNKVVNIYNLKVLGCLRASVV